MSETILKELHDAIVEGNRKQASASVQAALDAGVASEIILKDSMIPAMRRVGEMFSCGEYYVPEMLVAARAMQEGLTILKPHLVKTNIASEGKVVIGTVTGDMHDIGKNLVGMMLEGAGFEVIDLGINVPPAKFVDAIRAHHPDLVGMSALLTTTMPGMKTTLEALEAAGLRKQIKVLVGGAPVTPQFAQSIGADGYAQDASRAVELAKSLLAKAKA